MFFQRATRKAAAVIDAFHAAAPRLTAPEDVLAHAVYAGLARQAFCRRRAWSYEALPSRMLRDLAMVLVLVHDDRPSFDHALVMAGLPVADLVGLRRKAGYRRDLVEQVRLAFRETLARVRMERRVARDAARAIAAAAAGTPLHDPLEDLYLVPAAVVPGVALPGAAAPSTRLAA